MTTRNLEIWKDHEAAPGSLGSGETITKDLYEFSWELLCCPVIDACQIEHYCLCWIRDKQSFIAVLGVKSLEDLTLHRFFPIRSTSLGRQFCTKCKYECNACFQYLIPSVSDRILVISLSIL